MAVHPLGRKAQGSNLRLPMSASRVQRIRSLSRGSQRADGVAAE